MVYVPYEAVERLMLSKWVENTPKPTPREIRIEWYRILEFYPTDIRAFDTFVGRFPIEDRKKISFRPYTGTSTKPGRVRTRQT